MTYYGEEPYEEDDGQWIVIEFLQSGILQIPSGTTEVKVLVVAGGGGGGASKYRFLSSNHYYFKGGGGGGGGLILMDETPYKFSSDELTAGEITVTIGAGGAKATEISASGSNGADSIFGTLTAKGGGGGGKYNSVGSDGGSGGGGGGVYVINYSPTYQNGGADTQVDQEGNSGGYGWGTEGQTSASSTAGKGGGAYAQGGAYNNNGKTVWSIEYSKGGSINKSVNGTANTGTGGSGANSGADNTTITGGNGGSGIVIVKYHSPYYQFPESNNILEIYSSLNIKAIQKLLFDNSLTFTQTFSDINEIYPLYWDLNIVKGSTTYDLKDLNIIQDFDFNASYNRKSHNVSVRLFNDGNYYNVFRKGNDIDLYIYNDENNKIKIFNGMITSVQYSIQNYDESYILIRGEDKGSIRLKQKLITGDREFINKTVPEIITELIDTYAPDITTTQVYSDTEELPFKKFSWIYLSDALDELAKLVNGYYYVDVNNDLVFKLYEDNKPKHEINKHRIIRAQFGENYEDTFDRVYVLGGKENILENDFADEDVVTNINCIDYYYAVKVTTRAVNINKVSVVCAKVGLPRYNLGFSIIADKNGEPLGQVMGTGSIDTWDIGETPDWVDSSSLNIPLITDTFWIVFNLYTNEDEYFVLYHDNTTVNGHYRSEDIETWVTQTGALAVKTYYGIQIVSTRTGTKQLNDYYSELLVTDESIETIEMGERTAEQKLVEKIGQNSSSLTVIPNLKPIMPAEEIRLSISDVLNDEQVVTNVTYSIDDNKVLFIELECIKAIDFYTAFADLYNAIKKINIKNTTSRGGKNIEYIGQQETFDEPIEDINIYERDAVDDDPALGDDDFIFGVFKW